MSDDPTPSSPREPRGPADGDAAGPNGAAGDRPDGNGAGAARPASPRASFHPGGFDPNTGSLKESFEQAFGEEDDDPAESAEADADRGAPVADEPERGLHPATQQMLTSMPPLIARGIIYAVVLFIAVAGVWAYLSKTDVVVRGTAVVTAEAVEGEAGGQVVQVHSRASVGAVVGQLRVKAGDRVSAGDVLMTLTVQNLERLQAEAEAATLGLQLAEAELARHDEVRTGELDDQLAKLEERRAALRRTKQHNADSLRELEAERQSRVDAIDDDVAARRARLTLMQAAAAIGVRQLRAKELQLKAQRQAQLDSALRFEAQAASAKREYEQLRAAADQQMVEESRATAAHLQWLQMENELASAREQAQLLQLQIEQIDVDIEKLQSEAALAAADLDREIQGLLNELATVEAGHRVKIKEYDRLDAQTDAQLAEIDIQESQLRSTLSRERVALVQAVDKARLQHEQAQQRVQLDESLLVITAPIDGELTMMGATRVGEFVQPGQHLATVAGPAARMVAQITIENKDIGGLREGQQVKLKFDAWNFQNWGVVTGEVVRISPDATKNEQSGGYVYRIHATFDASQTSRRGKQIDVRYGMTATAEIIQRQRRVIDLLLEPFQKLSESFSP